MADADGAGKLTGTFVGTFTGTFHRFCVACAITDAACTISYTGTSCGAGRESEWHNDAGCARYL
jgi:hypothetical protein